jgi:predicted nucleotidyltransferase
VEQGKLARLTGPDFTGTIFENTQKRLQPDREPHEHGVVNEGAQVFGKTQADSARAVAMITGGDLMKNREIVERAQEIVRLAESRGAKVERIFVVGSHAKGTSHSGSDYDFSVKLSNIPPSPNKKMFPNISDEDDFFTWLRQHVPKSIVDPEIGANKLLKADKTDIISTFPDSRPSVEITKFLSKTIADTTAQGGASFSIGK